MFEIGLEAEPLGFCFVDLRIDLFELVNDDILSLFKRYGLVIFPIPLKFLVGRFEPRF